MVSILFAERNLVLQLQNISGLIVSLAQRKMFVRLDQTHPLLTKIF